MRLKVAKNSISSLTLLYAALVIVVSLLVILPLGLLIFASFWSTGPFTGGGYFTLENYVATYLDPATYSLFVNTFIIAVGVTVVAGVTGIGLAWVVARTNVPFKRFIVPIALFPQLVPSYLIATAYIFLLGPQIGWLNFLLEQSIGTTFSIYSFWGIIFVQGISYTPLAFIITLPAFRNFDPALEESSRMSGAGAIETLRNITLPMVAPAVTGSLLLIFTKSLETFSVPAFLGIPADPTIHVFATRLWVAFSRDIPPDYGLGTALATTLLLIGGFGLLIQQKATADTEKYVSITGSAYTADNYDLGKGKWVALLFAIGFLFVTILFPFGILFIASLTSAWFGEFFLFSDRVSFTLRHYETLFTMPDFATAVLNSIIVATVGAFLTMIIATFTSYCVYKVTEDDSNFIASTSNIIDQITYIPAAVPAIVMATGFLWAALLFPQFGLYGSLWLIMLGYMGRALPESTRTTHGGITQIDDILEDQARISGASWLQTIKDIITPLISRSFVAGYLLVFMDMMKNLSIPLLLYDQDSLVLPVLIFNLQLEGQYEVLAAVGIFLFILLMIVLAIAQLVFDVSLMDAEQ